MIAGGEKTPAPTSTGASGSNTDSSGDRFAAELRGFGPIGMLAILVIAAGNFVFLPLSAVLVLLWAWRSHTPWPEIGYVRPSESDVARLIFK